MSIHKHVQVADDLKRRIQSGEWEIGDQMPILKGIESQYSVSMRIASSTYRLLASEGYVRRTSGQGTYLASVEPVGLLELSDPTPRYLQIINDLKRRIRSGEWVVGDQMPIQKDIAGRYSVTMSVAHRTYQALAGEGYIRSTSGKGSYLISAEPVDTISRHDQIINDLKCRIRSGEWVVGDQMPIQERLALQYSVEADAICDVYQALAASGYVRTVNIATNSGAYSLQGIYLLSIKPTCQNELASQAKPIDQRKRISSLISEVKDQLKLTEATLISLEQEFRSFGGE